MWYGFKDILRDTAGLTPKSDHLRKREFWAVDDVSFELKKGETLGLIGPNGAGKSTILKMLNGIILPDKGGIRIKGRVGALIQIGAGFHPQLTGRENIYINGTILGMNKREINKKFDAIVDFADIGDFLDTPVKHYSSGMFVRLGFAVAVHCEPDILLVDEVLAVGDFQFQRKCIDRMSSLIKRGVTVIFISHNLPSVGGFCKKGILLDKGCSIKQGNIDEVIQRFLLMHSPERDVSVRKATARKSDEVVFRNVQMIGSDHLPKFEFSTGERVTIRVHFHVKSHIKKAIFGYKIRDEQETICCANRTVYNDVMLDIAPGDCFYEFQIRALELHTGRYMLGIVLFDDNLILPYANDPEACSFTIRSPWLEADLTSPIVLPRTIWSKKVNTQVLDESPIEEN